MVEVNPAVKETKINIVPATVSSSVFPSHDNPQVQILLEKSTSSSSNGISRDSKNKVTSNSNAHVVVIDQTNVDTSLPHQTVPFTETCHIQQHLLPEGQQTSPGVTIDDNDDDSGLITSLQAANQLSQQQSPSDAATTLHSREQIPCLKKESKMGVWMSMISSGSIVSVLSELVGNHENSTNNSTHKIILRTFITLNYVSFVLGVGLFLLTSTRPKIPGLVTIVKIAMWTALGSITCALSCATYLLAFTLK